MRFRPANISLINRRLYLPRLLLSLSSKDKNKDKNKNSDEQLLTGSHHINFRVDGQPSATQEFSLNETDPLPKMQIPVLGDRVKSGHT